MASMTDMLHMAHVCEGTVYSEEISKQYLESIKTVKQVDAINQHQRVQVKAEAVVEAKAKATVNIDLNQKADHQATVPIVV